MGYFKNLFTRTETLFETEVDVASATLKHALLDAELEAAKVKIKALDAVNLAKRDVVNFLEAEKARVQADVAGLRARVTIVKSAL